MTLNREIIETPEMWALALRISPEALDVVLRGPESHSQSVICRHIPLQRKETHNLCKDVEDAIYANPLLLSDFRSVRISVSTQDLALVPAELEAEAEEIAAALNPDPAAETQTVILTAGAHREILLASLVPTVLLNFLRRTFANPEITHPLASAATYLAHSNSMGNSERTYAIAESGLLTLAAFGPDNRLTLLNSYATPTDSDAAYYTLALAPHDKPLIIGGTPTLRNRLSELLRQYCSAVMPMTLSPDMIHLLSATENDIPTDLLMLSLL